MKNFIRLLIPVVVLVIVATALSVFAQAATLPDKVIYIATTSKGLGDGTSPENAMGNLEGYSQKLADEMVSGSGKEARKMHAFRNAYVEASAKDSDGKYLYNAVTIVLVEDIICECADAYRASPAEWTLSNPGAPTVITVTSKYNGTDYGGKLVLDRTKFPSTNMVLNTATIWQDLTVEYRTNDAVVAPADWEPEYMIEASVVPFTVEDSVTVISKDYTDPAAVKDGTRYPAILGGHRYSSSYCTGKDTKVTIRGGTWSAVYAGSHGMNAEHHASVKNAEVIIEGGKIERVLGASSDQSGRFMSVVEEKSTVTIKGGEVGAVYALTGGGVIGLITVKVVGAPKIGAIYPMQEIYLGADPALYELDLRECTAEKEIIDAYYTANKGAFEKMEIKVPTGYVEPVIPETTVAPETTATPETTTAPETTAKPVESADEPVVTAEPVAPSEEEGGSNVGLIIAIVAVVAVVAVAVVIVAVKKKKSA